MLRMCRPADINRINNRTVKVMILFFKNAFMLNKINMKNNKP